MTQTLDQLNDPMQVHINSCMELREAQWEYRRDPSGGNAKRVALAQADLDESADEIAQSARFLIELANTSADAVTLIEAASAAIDYARTFESLTGVSPNSTDGRLSPRIRALRFCLKRIQEAGPDGIVAGDLWRASGSKDRPAIRAVLAELEAQGRIRSQALASPMGTGGRPGKRWFMTEPEQWSPASMLTRPVGRRERLALDAEAVDR
jgi:hypothetical protein